MKYTFLLILVLFLLVVLASLFIANENDLSNVNVCSNQEQLNFEIWNAVITKKFKDSLNHNSETIVFSNDSVYPFFRNGTKLFQFVDIHDSIVKPRGTSLITVYRDRKMYTFMLDYGCHE